MRHLDISLKMESWFQIPKEVPIVQYIFSSYLAGHSMDEIATFLNDQEAKVQPKGNDKMVSHIDSLHFIE